MSGARGAKMLDGVESIKIHGQWIAVRARVKVMNGLSRHGDYLDFEHWLKESSQRKNVQIQLIHGDTDALQGKRDHLRRTTTFNVEVAGYHNKLTL